MQLENQCNGSVQCQYASQLTHRALVKMEGEDGRSFLQGFVTADVEDEEREEGRAFYSMMLNAQVGELQRDATLL